MPARSPRYLIRHETEYQYAAPVALSQHILHLCPRDCPWQQVESFALAIDPAPTRQHQETDVFGNTVVRIGIESPHRGLRVLSQATVKLAARPWAGGSGESGAWETLRDGLAFGAGGPLDPCRYQFASPYVRIKSDLTAYAGPSFPPGRPLLAAAGDLMQRIHDEFSFAPGATEVGTSVLDLLTHRRGVCQDFAHFMIGCLRSLGLPARYVSGYLLTEPPPGAARLAGADASHAWVALWCPEFGWIEFDPTNACLADERHIVVAWGRDFGDVSPLRGVIHGGDKHRLAVRVTVSPCADD